jgi:hypothetical protein
MEQRTERASLGQRWRDTRPTKAIAFWVCLGSVVVTMIVGFSWGGWVTGGTAQSMAQAAARHAVVTRLAPICLLQFRADPATDKKLSELKEESHWQRGEYISKHGWATMPGESEPDRNVADECANLLVQTS